MKRAYAAARLVVLARDAGRCLRCNGRQGLQTHHRIPRGMGGSRDPLVVAGPANLATVCAACHTWAESHRAAAFEAGYLVHRGGDPAVVPVLTPAGWVRLTATGEREPVAERMSAVSNVSRDATRNGENLR